MQTLHEAIGAFIVTIQNAQTARSYRDGLARFEQIAPAELARVDETYLTPFSETLEGYSIATKQINLNAVTSFFAFLILNKHSEAVSLDRARQVKRKLLGRNPKRISNYNMSDLQRLVDYAKSLTAQGRWDDLETLRDRALILTLAETGLRKSEAVGLKLSDVDLEQGQAVVIGKGNKQAVVYFGPASQSAVTEYIEARPNKDLGSPLFMRHSKGGTGWTREAIHLHGTSVNKVVNRRACEVLGHGIAVHALRHYFVTSVWRKHHDMKLAQELARHESILTTERYTHVSDDELRNAHRRVFA
jgi:integrase/recombinase XerC